MTEHSSLTPSQKAAGVIRLDENIALRSGAGCGKTLVLAQRFTQLLLNSKDLADPLGRFVGLTFTDKAALEMSQRIRTMLQALAKGKNRQRLFGWLEQLPEARISTIHSFCASLLRSYAIEAELDPDFAVCGEKIVTDYLLADATEQAVLGSIETKDAGAAALLTRISFTRLVELVRGLVDQRAQCDLTAYDNPDETLRRWEALARRGREKAQQRLIEDSNARNLLDELVRTSCSDPSDKLLEYRDRAVEVAGWILEAPLEEAGGNFDALAKIKPGNRGSDKNWGQKGSAKQVRDSIKALQAALGEYAICTESFDEQDRLATETLQTLTHLAQQANRLYRDAKRSRRIVDFTDLITSARDLLSSDEKLRKTLGEGIDQLLIDEAQDTDATQINLLLSLLAGGSEKGETPVVPPDGRLFLVGDAKQSIYRFRGARVEVFEDLCERLGQKKQIDLDASFRTHAPGVAFINDLFGNLMGADYSPILSKRSERPDGASVEILLACGPENKPIENARQSTAAQAALTAQRIEEMLIGREQRIWDRTTEQWREVRPGDVAILFARMTNSLPYERELQKRNIPYYVVAGTGFFQQQEVYDVLNALRVIDSPFDDIALFGVLRSAMFGLDDNTLMHIAETHTPPYLPSLDPDRLKGKIDEAQLATLYFACGLLRRLAAQKDAMGIEGLMRCLLDETGYEAVLLGQFQGRRMAGNIHLLLAQGRAAEGQMSLGDFLAQMGELTLNESRYEQAAVAGESEDVVRLLTIHKAKGLEFPVVFVPDLNAGQMPDRHGLLHRGDWGLTTKVAPNNEAEENHPAEEGDPLSYRLANALENEDQQRETIRKYYVAFTRHRDHLVLIGAEMRDSSGQFKGPGSFLQQMDEVLGITDCVDSGRESLSYGEGKFSAHLRCVLPAAPRSKSRELPPGRNILNSATGRGDVADAILRTAKKLDAPPPKLLGPLDNSIGHVDIATTALSEFEHCPMLYHWRYELRAPAANYKQTNNSPTKSEIRPSKDLGRPEALEGPNPKLEIDPLTLGTLLHRCMELLDFTAPQPPEVLAKTVLEEMDLLGRLDAEPIMTQVDEILGHFRSHELSRNLAEATEVQRELDFVTSIGRATLRGKIDLFYRDKNGVWCVVDYKSDRLGNDSDLSVKAARYELQLLVYADAVARYTGVESVNTSLYFLRTGRSHRLCVTPQHLAAAQQRIETLTAELIAARRTGTFRRCEKPTCDFCSHPPTNILLCPS